MYNLDNPEAWQNQPVGEQFAHRLARQVSISTQRMFRNIQPGIKLLRDGTVIAPQPGAIIAAPGGEPDYSFAWVRDSSQVIRSVINLLRHSQDQSLTRYFLNTILDYVEFSEIIQNEPTPYGLGDPRFNVNGTIDTIPWSRPQHDGPALRALILMYLLRVATEKKIEIDRGQVLAIILRDLNYLSEHWMKPCFDIWESFIGLYYCTQLFAYAAFLHAQMFVGEDCRFAKFKELCPIVRRKLDTYYRDNFIAYSQGELFDVNGKLVSAPGGGLDAGVVMAVVMAKVYEREHSIIDPRVLSTAAIIEELFAGLYPLNSRTKFGAGTAIGRHKGDGYEGGGAWFFITAAYPEMHYDLAAMLLEGYRMPITEENKLFFSHVAARSGISCSLGDEVQGKSWIEAAIRRGDDFLNLIMNVLPEDGSMSEQFHPVTGEPLSARDLTWSHAEFLNAAMARLHVCNRQQELDRFTR